jgi:hypothetical protein
VNLNLDDRKTSVEPEALESSPFRIRVEGLPDISWEERRERRSSGYHKSWEHIPLQNKVTCAYPSIADYCVSLDIVERESNVTRSDMLVVN